MTSIGVPIHCAASEPEIDAFRITARPASNAATHASRVSRSVPSMSKRTARSLGTSRLLLAEPPDRRRDAAIEEDRDRIVPPQQEAVRSGLRLVERHVVQRDRHAELVPESTEEVCCLLPAEPRAPTDLQGH